MKTAIVTGIKRVGREISLRLLEEGYDLCVVYRESSDTAWEIEDRASSLGRKVVSIRADLSEPESCEFIVKTATEELGGISALVHLASPYYRTPIEKLSPEDINAHFNPIASAFLLLSKLSFEVMKGNEGQVKGRILAFGDWAVECTPYKNYPAYFISKGALHTAVKVLAKEFAPHVLVNCIALGPTLKAEELSDEEWERILRNTPLKRQVSIKDVVETSMLLLRCESITGELVRIDGGRHIAGSGLGSVG